MIEKNENFNKVIDFTKIQQMIDILASLLVIFYEARWRSQLVHFYEVQAVNILTTSNIDNCSDC